MLGRYDSGSNSAFYYSFDFGLVHYVAIDTEIYLFDSNTRRSKAPFEAADQIQWLDQDLARANANRESVPWIIVFGHKGARERGECNKLDSFSHAAARRFTVSLSTPLGAHGSPTFVTRLAISPRPGWYMTYNKPSVFPTAFQVDFTGFAALLEKHKVDLYLCGHEVRPERGNP